jgi:hypothetical protein
MTFEKISRFTGPFRFLSNFYIEDDGKSVEHRFQAVKTLDESEREFIYSAPTAAAAKRRGRQVTMRQDWDEVKEQVMEFLLTKKFEDPRMRKLLLQTGDARLEEGNYWGDEYWGVDMVTGEGLNRLGILLMKIRKRISQEEDQ